MFTQQKQIQKLKVVQINTGREFEICARDVLNWNAYHLIAYIARVEGIPQNTIKMAKFEKSEDKALPLGQA